MTLHQPTEVDTKMRMIYLQTLCPWASFASKKGVCVGGGGWGVGGGQLEYKNIRCYYLMYTVHTQNI